MKLVINANYIELLSGTKQKLMEKIQCFENLVKPEPDNLEKWMSLEDDDVEEEEETNEVEEKARQVLNHVEETSSLNGYRNISTDKLLWIYFEKN